MRKKDNDHRGLVGLVFRRRGSIFFRKRESDCIVFPTSIECSFKREARNIFSDEKQARPCLDSFRFLKKMGLILVDL